MGLRKFDMYYDYLDEYIKEKLPVNQTASNLIIHITYEDLRKILRDFPEWLKARGIGY